MYAQTIISELFQLSEYTMLWEELKNQYPNANFTEDMDNHRLSAAADTLVNDLQFIVSSLETEGHEFSEQELAVYLCNKMILQKARLLQYITAVLLYLKNEELSDSDAEASLAAAGTDLSELGMTLEEFKQLLKQGDYDKSCLLEYFIPFEVFSNYQDKLDAYRAAIGEANSTYIDELFVVYTASLQ
ncbi:hypothetical protein LI951_03120 [Enterococcus sp. BWT-B8]|uniref:hypothetical protein n=1 Tax=Enterococcus sp. BWT-B8 TaxID=2885157 RepID=UPI001E34BD6C|nr:hypothetical protein [Enterococcus sp. BWT-B8]MCB5951051.1 hypothetical protein [Enterococcus sp. BWT-B8]